MASILSTRICPPGVLNWELYLLNKSKYDTPLSFLQANFLRGVADESIVLVVSDATVSASFPTLLNEASPGVTVVGANKSNSPSFQFVL
jgi:hypothetical protein